MAIDDPNNINPHDAQQRLKSDTRQLAQDLDDLLAQLPNLTGDAIESAKQAFLSKAASGQDKLASIKTSVADSVSRGQECVTEYVHQQPMRSLGMALGLGVVLGALLCRPSSRYGRDD
ncbi:MAG: DUF883 domain-containing protein [Cupriavidus sp.]|jgi:ElaB/YqjD/DUF883 family membrane-anchored ribosome-binding protein|uniref:DUF883 family protein n=1 Tax=Cupriavidus pauculus TaxID=82633 RepID=UPI00078492C1|nr:DUF883 family protein [Cupriavidus pauculus]MBU69192.1 DUF883 domain-containing protein [Cupriavidus sp.]KAB0602974.1 DUF883 domain-containing protein [Cupriavidus pauculus]MBY4730441.1 DUF883 family protein [Cupriavidus pauculus]MCM3608138.1 DUF883 family protein [Cupriavidus pauculus]UAL03117.1 DUF883 family protein [Cupriavidus pauculus]